MVSREDELTDAWCERASRPSRHLGANRGTARPAASGQEAVGWCWWVDWYGSVALTIYVEGCVRSGCLLLPTLSGRRGEWRGAARGMGLRGVAVLAVVAWLTGSKARPPEEQAVWAVSGRRANLPCTPAPREADDQPVLVLWYRAGDTLQPVFSYDARSGNFHSGKSWANPKVLGTRASFATHSAPPVLVLKPVLPHDQGEYTCRIDYRLSPSTVALVNLTVAIPPAPPMVIWRGEGVAGMLEPLKEGTSVELLCRSEGGRPPPQLTWWWRGARLPTRQASSLHSSTGVVESSLVMKASRALHGATLTCHAQTPTPDNAAATALPQPLASSVTLNVTLPPLSVEILGPKEPITSGVSVKLVCRTYGSHPPAHVTWWQGNTRLSEVTSFTDDGGNVTTATVTLAVRQEHNGVTLVCTASNPLLPHASVTATRTLEVFYKPMVELQLGRHLDGSQLMEGNDVFFECQVKANPSVLRLYFYHNGAEVVQDLTAGVVVSGRMLVMRRLRREQSGYYTCAAANQEGHNTSNAVHLLVQHAPVCAGADLQRTLGVARTTPVTVTCRVEAEPAQDLSWSWVRTLEDGQEHPIPAADVESVGLTSSVEVMVMSTQDYGNLLCKASNAVGRQQEPCVVRLIPAGPPDPPANCSAAPSEPQDAAAFTLSLAVVCFEGFDGGLPQQFLLEAWQSGLAMANMTSDFPEWEVDRLESGLDTTLFIVAFNARGSSDKLLLEVPTARAQQQAAAPESESLGVPTLLGAAAGVVAVLLLSLTVSVMLARHSRLCRTKGAIQDLSPAGTPRGSVWECYEPQSSPCSRNHQIVEGEAHAQSYTSLLETYPDSPRKYLNSHILNYSTKLDNVEFSCQVSDSCSDSSCDSKAESVVEVSELNRQCWPRQDERPHDRHPLIAMCYYHGMETSSPAHPVMSSALPRIPINWRVTAMGVVGIF
ncbi:hypothetical protein O3P69_008236 [Scylla paramamosain]|uniref:Ig-like domain-containing protein n=1 Tax=Scylla paramamosain TaxID=85552 RepID=A0AAW0T1W9_SCYPA